VIEKYISAPPNRGRNRGRAEGQRWLRVNGSPARSCNAPYVDQIGAFFMNVSSSTIVGRSWTVAIVRSFVYLLNGLVAEVSSNSRISAVLS
jgi:hypothetical protein